MAQTWNLFPSHMESTFLNMYFISFGGDRSILRPTPNHTQASLELPALSDIQLFIMRKYYPIHEVETMTKETKLYQMCTLDMDTNG